MASFTDKARVLERVRLLLRRRYGETPRLAVTHPVEHVLRAILAEEATDAQVDRAVEALRRHFVDFNDLRVSRPREIREAVGEDFPRIGQKARVIPRLLDQVFKQHNSMVWDFLEQMGKVQTRTYFERLEEVRPFVAATIARDCVGAHAYPVDGDVARVLGRLGVLDPATESEADMQSLLERAVKAGHVYESHWLVKRLAQDLCVAAEPRCPECPLKALCPSAVRPSRAKAAKPARGARGKDPAEGRAGPKKPASGKAGRRRGARARPASRRKTSSPPRRPKGR